MIRLIGAILLTAGSAALGIGAAFRLKMQVSDLRGMICGLEAMQRRLTADLAPLERMLADAVQNTDGRPKRLFEYCQRNLNRDTQNFAGLWQAALETEAICLGIEGVQELKHLGSILGRFDADNQSIALEQAVQRMGAILSAAEEKYKTSGKVYGTAGVSAGLLMTILLL